jgi:hypothetical protein
MNEQQQTRGSLGLSSLMFLIFLVLKLTGHIDWSWWWVTSPLWIVWAVVVVAIVVGAGIHAVAELHERVVMNRRRKQHRRQLK